jgi:hypothetical protein
MPVKRKSKPKAKVGGGRYTIMPVAPKKGLVKRKPQKVNKLKRKRKK